MQILSAEELEEIRDIALLKLSLLQLTQQHTYRLHPLIREFFQEKLKGLAQADDLKRAFAAKMVAVAEQIPPNPTLQHITEFTRVIPHLIQSQLQLQPELSEIQQLLQQSNQDREHLQFQLSQVLEQTSQKQLQELVSTIFPSDARFTELQTHLQQTQQKILQLQSALATGGFIPGTVSAEAQTLILDNTLSDSSIITIYCLGTGPGNYKLLDGRTGDGTGGLAPDTGKRYSGIRWQVYRIGRNEYQIYCLGTEPGKLGINDRAFLPYQLLYFLRHNQNSIVNSSAPRHRRNI